MVNQTESNVDHRESLTNIDYVGAILLTFRGDIIHPKDERLMAQWEMAVYKFSQTFNSSLIEMLVLGAEIIDYEMNRDSQRAAPFFIMGE